MPYDHIGPSSIGSARMSVIVRLIKLPPDDVLSCLNGFTNGNKPYTKRVRYSHLSAFFNYFRNNIDTDMGNPCDTPMIRKLYRERVISKWEIIEKETIDEIIFRTVRVTVRNYSTGLRRIWVRLQGTSSGAYRDTCRWM